MVRRTETFFHSLRLFLSDLNKCLLGRSETAANQHIYYLLKFEEKEKSQLASETLPGQQEGRRQRQAEGNSSMMHTPEPAQQSDRTLSDPPQPEVLQHQRQWAWPGVRPSLAGVPSRLQNLCSRSSGTKIVGSTDTNGFRFDLFCFFFVFGEIVTRDLHSPGGPTAGTTVLGRKTQLTFTVHVKMFMFK